MLDYYIINISEITIEELKKQIIDKYKEELSNLKESYKKFKNIHNIKFDEDEEVKYDEILEKLMEDYIKFHNINIVKTKNISLQNLLNRAINKKKPVVGENGNSDKGFKDAVLWESIIEYAKKSENTKFILFTKNIQDFPKALEDEFKDITNKKIEILNEISVVQERILLENSKKTKDILTLNWLKDNIQIVIDEINSYFEKSTDWKDYQIVKIDRIEDLIIEGNNFYSFMIFEIEDETKNERQWYVKVNYKNDEMNIDEVIPCA